MRVLIEIFVAITFYITLVMLGLALSDFILAVK